MIIDCHAHVFQNWHGACGHPSIDVHLKYIQKNVTRPAAETFRVRDGMRVKPGLLFRDGDNTWAGLKDVDFRIGRYGRLEFMHEGEEYAIQYMPVGMQTIESPPEFMIAQMLYAGVDHCILQAGGGYGAMNDYNAFTQHAFPEKFTGLLHIDEAVADREDVLAEADRAHALGLKGLYYSHDFSRHGYARNLDDDAFRPFWDRIARWNFPAFVELSATPDYDKKSYIANLMALDRLMQRYPATRFVLVMGPPVAHFAGDRELGFPARRACGLQARKSPDRDHVSDHLGRRLGVSVSRGAGTDPPDARPVRRVQAGVGLRHAERRALLHLPPMRRLRAQALHVSEREREGRRDGPQRRSTVGRQSMILAACHMGAGRSR